ncbi:pentatricopeptide repeat-containing protein At4g33990-like [Tripterygium wilfordii]|uniref:pentatricopeptide repeat-containing protein At4g33990-like n=1 Tax=Tripterygium wilfordii TaxID=458696 RepID=UPI0018F82369|nr:pentatricopeptide repeat-containing protein At4g33990-like [Tripterygium wilfordii]
MDLLVYEYLGYMKSNIQKQMSMWHCDLEVRDSILENILHILCEDEVCVHLPISFTAGAFVHKLRVCAQSILSIKNLPNSIKNLILYLSTLISVYRLRYYSGACCNFGILFDFCIDLGRTKCLHAFLVVSGNSQSSFLSTRLVNRYAFLRDVPSSRTTFNQIANKDVYTWNSIVSALVRSGHYRETVDCFYQFLLTSGLHPDFYTFPPVLKACRNLFDGRKIHCSALKLGLEWDVFVAASLIHMYTRFGIMIVARQLFDDMPSRDRGSWNAMISGYCQNGNAVEALNLLDEMKLDGNRMDSVTVTSILSICAQLDDILSGLLIHLHVIKHGLEFELFVSNALINMYAKFGKLGLAQRVFYQMVEKQEKRRIVALQTKKFSSDVAWNHVKHLPQTPSNLFLTRVDNRDVSEARLSFQTREQRVLFSFFEFFIQDIKHP